MRKAFESLLFTSLARDSTCSYPSLQCTVQVRNPETLKPGNKLTNFSHTNWNVWTWWTLLTSHTCTVVL